MIEEGVKWGKPQGKKKNRPGCGEASGAAV
jgi:hypothetical protein